MIKKVTDTDGDRYVPDLPELSYGLVLVFCMDRNFYADALPPETEGQDAIVHVVYKSEDDATMQQTPGKLGLGNEVTKLDAYKEIVVTTIADVKIAEEKERLTKEAEAKGETVKQADLDKVDYKGLDAADGYPLFVFLQKDYVDR